MIRQVLLVTFFAAAFAADHDPEGEEILNEVLPKLKKVPTITGLSVDVKYTSEDTNVTFDSPIKVDGVDKWEIKSIKVRKEDQYNKYEELIDVQAYLGMGPIRVSSVARYQFKDN